MAGGSLLAALAAWPAEEGAAFPPPGTEAARVRRVFEEARAAIGRETTNGTAAWQLARAAFDWAEFATNNAQRAAIAEEGIRAGRAAVASQPTNAAAHYYLALNLGQLARTRTLGALKLVSEMETLFERAIQLDAHFDFAGAHRSLGLLYKDAPGWPASVGNNRKAGQHLREAVRLASNHPENRLCLLEALLEWGRTADARAEFAALETLWSQARGRLTGPEWGAAWVDWQTRRTAAKARLEKAPADR